jgi:long-chain fatty acid transport protein
MMNQLTRLDARGRDNGAQWAPYSVAWGVAFALLLPLLATPAQAQLRPAMAGNFATAENAATAYFNPAGMTRLDRREFAFDTTFAYTESQFEVNSDTTMPGGDSDKDRGLVMVPSMYFATPAFHERIRIGGSLNVPSGIGASYGHGWSGRYISTESSLFYVAINGGAAVRVTDWLSLGGSLEILYTSSESKSKINNGPNRPDGEVKLELSGIGVGGSVALLVTPNEWIRFGLVYRPKTETDVDGVPEIKGAGPVLTGKLAAAGLFNQKVTVDMNSPQRVSAGVAIEPLDRLSIAADFSWIDMGQFSSVDVSISDFSTSVDGKWKDTYLIGVSIGWDFTDRLQGLVGFSHLTEPVSDSNRNFSLPVDRIYIVGAGARYLYEDWIELSGAVNYFDLGDARVDSQPGNPSSRVAGKFSPNYAIGFNVGIRLLF